MDIEQLNKSQIILLVLLVSFVTSIATGIVTVSLMEQAPPALTQTVNRVVERTVEKVVPASQTGAAVTTETTVVVKEADLIVESVKKISPSLVKLHTKSAEPGFLGLGVVISSEGDIVTDSATVGDIKNIIVELSQGSRVNAVFVSRDDVSGTSIFKAESTTSDAVTVQFTPALLALDTPPLGQTIVVLSGKSIPRIADGLVTAHIPQSEGKKPVIDTNVSADFVMGGSPLVNTDGSLVGVSTSISRASSPGAFVPSAVLVRESTPAQ